MAEPRSVGIQVKTERRPAADALREFERTLKNDGAIEFDLPYGEGKQSNRHVVALLEAQTPIPVDDHITKSRDHLTKKFVPEFVQDDTAVVSIVGSIGWDFSDERFALDLHDAPEEMRAAVERAWSVLELNARRFTGADAAK